MSKIRVFSLLQYTEMALKKAEYHRDEDDVVIAVVPGASGFYAQGDSVDEARVNLEDVIQGNLTLALQMNLPFPALPDLTPGG